VIPIETILEDFGEKLVNDLRAALKANNVGYGGQDSKLAAQIRFRVIPKNEGISFQLLMPDYGEFVDRGRGSGPVSKKGIEKIGEWARAKGIVGKYQDKELQERIERQNQSKQRAKAFSKQGKKKRAERKWKQLKKLPFNKAKQQLAFAIASKIRAKGYEGNNFFTSTINDGRLDTLATDLKDYGLENFKFDI
jgi:hypothetical protein